MSIKMPVKFVGNYQVITRHAGTEKQEVCQKLSMTPLAGQGRPESSAEEGRPAYLITYFCFGCRRVLEGQLKENQEDRVVFQADDKEYEFRPTGKIC